MGSQSFMQHMGVMRAFLIPTNDPPVVAIVTLADLNQPL